MKMPVSYSSAPCRITGPFALVAMFLAAIPFSWAAEIPSPVWLLNASDCKNGNFETTIPKGDGGEVVGNVTVEDDAIVFSGEPGSITFAFAGEGVFSGQFTVVARLAPEGINGYGPILTCNPPRGFGIALHPIGGFTVTAGGQWHAIVSNRDTQRKGDQQFVVVTFDGSSLKLYVDGVEIGEVALERPPHGITKLVVGSNGRVREDGSITDVSIFRLKELSIYETVLTIDQISALANNLQTPTN